MGASNTSGSAPISGINVTPLVDVVLVLLIILMVTATSIVAETIPMELPSAATGEESAESVVLAVSVDRSGAIFVDAEPSDGDGLRRTLRRLRAQRSDISAVVGADEATRHGHVVAVIDTLREEGVLQFAIQVKNPEESP